MLQRRRPRSERPYYTFRDGASLHIHWSTTGCKWGNCLICDYGRSANTSQLDNVRQAFAVEVFPFEESTEVLLLGSLGSVLDEGEFPLDAFGELLHQIAKTNVSTVIFETSCISITEERMRSIRCALPDKEVFVELGFESSSDAIRRLCIGKQSSSADYAQACSVAHSFGVKTIANIVLGAPFLTRDEQFSDALRSVDWAFSHGFDEVALFPINIKPYSLVRLLYERGLYEPVLLSDLFLLLDEVASVSLSRVSLAWWGNRDMGYSFPTVGPLEGCPGLYGLCGDYMAVRDDGVRNACVKHALELMADFGVKDKGNICASPNEDTLLARMQVALDVIEAAFPDERLVWVSPRESDMDGSASLYSASSTVYGSGVMGNDSYSRNVRCRVNHNCVTDDLIKGLADAQLGFAEKAPDSRFMFYNPYWAYGGDGRILSRAICMNSFELLEQFCNKLSFREFARGFVKIPECDCIPARKCSKENLSSRFPDWDVLVVQKGISSGGLESYLWRRGDDFDESRFVGLDEELLVSRYYEKNVPVNVHAVIYDEQVVILPPSVQIIDSSTGLLLYMGCDYVSYRDLSECWRDAVLNQALKLCEGIRSSGYRGVLGLDAMVAEGEVVFLEMNARFQASSHALSRALVDAGLPSLQHMQIDAFYRETPSFDYQRAENLSVPFSSLAYSSTGSVEDDAWAEHVLSVARCAQDIEVFDDGLDESVPRERDAYMFSLLFNKRVSSVISDELVNIAQNVYYSRGYAFPSCFEDESDLMALKIALLNQGAVVSPIAASRLAKTGKLREGVNSSIDVKVLGITVNVPLAAPYQEFTPFTIDCDSAGNLGLYRLGGFIGDVECFFEDPFEQDLINGRVPLQSICLLALDRVRVQHADGCDFACAGNRCAFCDFPDMRQGFDFDDIVDAVNRYIDSDLSFAHFMIGGGTDTSKLAVRRIADLARHIASRSGKPIYVMTTPIGNRDDLIALHDAGVTEIGFNIELVDDDAARRIMPAKGMIPRSEYYAALSEAVSIWGRSGAVRSALVVGIEPIECTLAGVERLSSLGVAPILSVFRPLRDTRMSDTIPPDNAWLMELYKRASEICVHSGIELGPSCRECRNNVLAI